MALVSSQHMTSPPLGVSPVGPQAYFIACGACPASGARSTVMASVAPTCEMLSATHWPVCGASVAPTSAENPE